MTQRSNPALSNPANRKSLSRLPNQIGRERSAFHHGQEPCAPTKAEYICADQPVTSFFACDKAADHTFRFADSPFRVVGLASMPLLETIMARHGWLSPLAPNSAPMKSSLRWAQAAWGKFTVRWIPAWIAR